MQCRWGAGYVRLIPERLETRVGILRSHGGSPFDLTCRTSAGILPAESSQAPDRGSATGVQNVLVPAPGGPPSNMVTPRQATGPLMLATCQRIPPPPRKAGFANPSVRASDEVSLRGKDMVVSPQGPPEELCTSGERLEAPVTSVSGPLF